MKSYWENSLQQVAQVQILEWESKYYINILIWFKPDELGYTFRLILSPNINESVAIARGNKCMKDLRWYEIDTAQVEAKGFKAILT